MERTLSRESSIAAFLLLLAFLAMLVTPPAGAVIPLREVPPSVSTAEGTVEISSDDGTQRFLLSAGRVWVQFDSATPGDRGSVTAPRLMVAATEPCTFVLDSDEDGAVVKVLDGRVDLSSDTGHFVSTLGAGEALIAAKSVYSLPTGFDVAAEQADWEPLLAGTTTTSIPGETTRTSTDRTTSTFAGTGTSRTYPPAEDSGKSGWTRWGIVLIVAAAVLFLALIAVATILLVLLSRRRPPYPRAAGAQHPGYGPPAGPVLQQAPPAGPGPPPAVTVVPTPPEGRPSAPAAPAFCRHCGAPLTSGARFCRSCGHDK